MRRRRLWFVWVPFFVLMVVINGLRFVHLDADFPPGITTSRALYTDEGLYSFNAIRMSAGRSWYVPGELNTSINLPVASILQVSAFRVSGHSLIVARSLVAVSAILLIAVSFALTLRYAPRVSAMLVAVALSCDFLLFSYSRLAILDVVMTAVVALAVLTASSIRQKYFVLTAVLAGLLIGIAALTKTTAVCAIPAVLYLGTAGTPGSTRRRQVVGIILVSCALVVGGYNALAWYSYPRDYIYFHRIAEVRLASGPLDFARNFVLSVLNTIRFDPWVSLTALGSAAVLFNISTAFRSNTLVRTSAIWILGFLVTLSITSYQPSRYFVVVLVPMAMLCGVAISHIGDLLPTRVSATAVRVTIVVCLLTVNIWHIGTYLRHPKYSFARMAREVGTIVNASTGNRHPGVLLGNMAASVSFESDISAISLEYGSQDLGTRIRTACPTHFIALEPPNDDQSRVLSSYYVVEPVKEWRVFGNYFEHQPVRLFRLRPRAGRLLACPTVAP
jgi:4-amino-4-deoxy-L-arabinose transferase-like glycosyltransferase